MTYRSVHLARPGALVAVALALCVAAAGCGKQARVLVKRPVIPIEICRRIHDEGYSPCRGEFDVGRLIGLRLPAARDLARQHGYVVRRVAPLAPHELPTADLAFNRIDVECNAPTEDAIVVRYVERG